MKIAPTEPTALERLLAALLHYGSWLASAAIALGLALSLIGSHFGAHIPPILSNLRLVTIGVALFILLPVLRVLLMLIVFLRERDYRFSAIAALVLTILAAGCFLGLHTTSATAKSHPLPAHHSSGILASNDK